MRELTQKLKKSAKHGAGEWLMERVTSIILIPLTLWAIWSGFDLAGKGFEGASYFLQDQTNAVLAGLTVGFTLWHMYTGIKVVIDDYLSKPATRGLLLFVNLVACAGLAAATLYAIAKIAFHGA